MMVTGQNFLPYLIYSTMQPALHSLPTVIDTLQLRVERIIKVVTFYSLNT